MPRDPKQLVDFIASRHYKTITGQPTTSTNVVRKQRQDNQEDEPKMDRYDERKASNWHNMKKIMARAKRKRNATGKGAKDLALVKIDF